MPQPVSIGFDAKRIVSNATGLGSYGRTLVNDLLSDPTLRIHLYAPDAGDERLRSQIQGPASLHWPRTAFWRHAGSLWRSWGIVGDLRRDAIQLYHGLSGELPLGIAKSGIPSVVTIHDLIFLRHPEYYHPVDTRIYAWKFRQTVRQATHIIAISECTRRDILSFADVDERRLSVIYQSCSPRFSAVRSHEAAAQLATLFPPGVRPPERYLLSVGTIEARKNILLAVKALPYLPPDLSLVVVGRHTPYTDQVTAYADAHHLSHRLHLLHGITDAQLPALYAMAECFVYPSRYEGFGIPIIEAVSSGLPVVACTGSCLEEAGGPDALYVGPDDAEAMAAAVRQVLRGADGREERIRRCQDYIRRFEGRGLAAQVADLYRSLL